MRWLGSVALVGLLLLAVACPPRLDRNEPGPEPVGDDDDATAPLGAEFDILMVVDNSSSMARIQEELQAAFPDLLGALTASGVSWQLGVTTTDMISSGAGNWGNLRGPGPVGDEGCGYELVTSEQEPEEAALRFRALVDVGVAGDGSEKAVLAAAMALCKGQDADFWESLDGLPEDDPVKQVCSLVPPDQQECNLGAFRAGAPTLVIVVSDEGDETEQVEVLPPSTWLVDCILEHNDDPFYGECQCRLEWWVDFFEGIGPQVVFVTVGPTFQLGSEDVDLCDDSVTSYPGPCNPFGSTVCSMLFHQDVACLAGGRFFPVEVTAEQDDPTTCDIADFAAVAEELTELLTGSR